MDMFDRGGEKHCVGQKGEGMKEIEQPPVLGLKDFFFFFFFLKEIAYFPKSSVHPSKNNDDSLSFQGLVLPSNVTL